MLYSTGSVVNAAISLFRHACGYAIVCVLAFALALMLVLCLCLIFLLVVTVSIPTLFLMPTRVFVFRLFS